MSEPREAQEEAALVAELTRQRGCLRRLREQVEAVRDGCEPDSFAWAMARLALETIREALGEGPR